MVGFVLLTLPMLSRAQNRHFEQVVAPLLIERCIDCHSGAKPKGGLDLTKKASAFKGAKSGASVMAKSLEQSTLWQRVKADEMPPKKPLPEAEKAILKKWIENGAVWGTDPIDPFRVTTSKRAGSDWWSLQPVRRPALPSVKQKDWIRNPIDQYILAKLEAEGLTPSPEADAGTLNRRLHYDLTGLPPLEVDPRDSLRSSLGLADKLLSSPHYGERWARHWLDVVRFGESNGFEHDELRRNAWPYRDWVIQAINKDMPYDEFARLQIAGDLLKTDDPAAVRATGFLVAGGFDTVGQVQQSAVMKAAVRQDELEDIVGTIGQTFLGLTVQCARCHDHKFDPVRIEEYYRLTAAVAGVRHGEREITSPQVRLAYEKQQAEFRHQLDTLRASLAELEKPIRAKILSERKEGKASKANLAGALARWDFTKGLKDEITGLEVKLHSEASLKADGLQIPAGNSYASTAPLKQAIGPKTLEVVVRLHDLTQRGGAPISLQSLDGQLFDAIVFGEREPGRWLPGSDGFRRTSDLGGPLETEARDKPVHFAITYQADGTITAYRSGVLHGKPYKANGLLAFEANRAMILFGLRHSPAGGNKHLAGTILRAAIYDKALTAAEVAASAGILADFVSDEEIVKQLDPERKAKRAALTQGIERAYVALAAAAPSTRVYAVAPRQPEATYLLLRGNPAQKGPLLTAGGVASLGLKADFVPNTDASEAERRLKLAEWITDAKNPLFARVMVNRLWHYHFGAGLVETPSDFGFNGARPSHPELLDWLADEFVRNGYRMKPMHRLIVNSATYRQSSRFRADAAKRDANNRLLWRKSPMRLEAEAVRDGILAAAGQLNLAPGGPGYQDFKITVRGATHYYTPIDADDAAVYRRSIYRTWARSGRSALLDALDCPDPSTVSPRRALTTTPLQALSMMNNAFVLRMTDRFAERLTKEAGANISKQVGRAYELAYDRHATDEEIARVRPVIERHGLAIFCRAVFNSNELVYVD